MILGLLFLLLTFFCLFLKIFFITLQKCDFVIASSPLSLSFFEVHCPSFHAGSKQASVLVCAGMYPCPPYCRDVPEVCQQKPALPGNADEVPQS